MRHPASWKVVTDRGAGQCKGQGHDVGGVECLAQLVADPVWARADEAVVLADAAIVRAKARGAGFEPIYLARWRHLAVAASKRSSAAL